MNLEKWIADYIIELNLCPFAAGTLKGKKWKVKELDFKDYQAIEELFYDFLKEDLNVVETYFITSDQLDSWEDFLFYFHFVEELTNEIATFNAIKIVGFHPEYRHGEVEQEAIHFSNRAPWPLIQLLNVEDVHKRTALMDVDKVLEDNELTLKGVPIEELQKKLDDSKG